MNELTLDYQLAHELTMRQLNDFFSEFGKDDLADVGGSGYEDRIKLFGVEPPVFDLRTGHDICKTPLPRQFERIICCNTFEHIIDPVKASNNLIKSLKPKGYLFLTTVWEYPFHAYEEVIDTYRYTHQALETLFKDLEKIKCWYEPETLPNTSRITFIGRKND